MVPMLETTRLKLYNMYRWWSDIDLYDKACEIENLISDNDAFAAFAEWDLSVINEILDARLEADRADREDTGINYLGGEW